jgi:hypothetical protein
VAAIAPFPDRWHAIEELARTVEDFRSLCDDLAEAEAALVRWERSSSLMKEVRCAEHRDLVTDLAAELMGADPASLHEPGSRPFESRRNGRPCALAVAGSPSWVFP